MVAKRISARRGRSDLDRLKAAGRMTEAEFIKFVRDYLTRNKGELDFTVITGHVKGQPGPDFVLPVVSTRRSRPVSGLRPRRA